MKNNLARFVQERRKFLNLTQEELAVMAGVGLRFLRELEQNKSTLRIDKVNQVLKLFGHEMGPVRTKPIDVSQPGAKKVIEQVPELTEVDL